MDVSAPRLLAALALALLAALAVDRGARRRGTTPPGFAERGPRLAAAALLAFVLFGALFLPLLAGDAAIDPALLHPGDLFVGQLLLAALVVGWAALGWAGTAQPLAGALRGLGLAPRRPGRELAVGVGAGLLAWGAVLATVAVAAAIFVQVAGEDAARSFSPDPELIVWMAGLPVAVRLAASLTAGVVEELFFRGLLQPRIGIAASTALFVAGHLVYGQPFLLLGVAALSLLYAALARWRGSVVAAMAAHALFDAVQLLVVIPAALAAGEAAAVPVATASPDPFW